MYSLELNLSKKSLSLAFFLSLICFLLSPLLLPKLKLFFFSPFLVILLYQKNKMTAVCGALFCGLMSDLFSVNEELPLFGLGFCLALLLLYDQRQHFFGDSISTLPIMVYFFGVLSTLLLGVLQETLLKQPQFSLKWLAYDAFLFPLADATYAFCFFILPALIFGKRQRRGSEYFSG